MSAERRLLREPAADRSDLGLGELRAATLVELLVPIRTGSQMSDERSAPQRPDARAALIDRIRQAGNQARSIEAQAKEQEQRVQEILQRVREDVQGADARVKAAEQRATEAQEQAAAQVRAAEERARASEERAKAAEERALVAEGWLQRVHQTVIAEFETKSV